MHNSDNCADRKHGGSFSGLRPGRKSLGKKSKPQRTAGDLAAANLKRILNMRRKPDIAIRVGILAHFRTSHHTIGVRPMPTALGKPNTASRPNHQCAADKQRQQGKYHRA
jgi:hypothetical protein